MSALRLASLLVIACLAVLTASRASASEATPAHGQDQARANCLVWHSRVEVVAGWKRRTGVITGDEATALDEVIATLGERCSEDDPEEVSKHFVRLLGYLTEYRAIR